MKKLVLFFAIFFASFTIQAIEKNTSVDVSKMISSEDDSYFCRAYAYDMANCSPYEYASSQWQQAYRDYKNFCESMME